MPPCAIFSSTWYFPKRSRSASTDPRVPWVVAEPSDYGTLEAMLGYTFLDRNLLEQALRHASWCNEHPAPRLPDNERLEFLGDAVLDLVVRHQLMTRYPPLRAGAPRAPRGAGGGGLPRQRAIGEGMVLGKGDE